MVSRKKLGLFVLSFSLFVFGVMLCFRLYLNGLEPVDGFEPEQVIDIESGMSSKRIAARLYDKELIRSKMAFLIYSQLHGVRDQLKAGRYEFNVQMSIPQIIEKLTKGEFLMQRFVVPEGSSSAQIAKLWARDGLGAADEFEQAAKDPDLIKKYGVLGETVEGYLFPETYKFAYSTSAKIAVETMLREFYKRVAPKLQQDAFTLGLSLHEIITLASIIEKEAQVDKDRPLISGVFHSRLRLGWKLEADPTVLYALGYPNRRLFKKDMDLNSKYNTYRYVGLPPGPICNPGLSSILAAIKPKITPYRYFVSNGDGTHRFSTTLQQHLQAISEVKKSIALANQPVEN